MNGVIFAKFIPNHFLTSSTGIPSIIESGRAKIYIFKKSMGYSEPEIIASDLNG
jgi:hypothetical protein